MNLTERHMEVLKHLANGLKAQEIGQKMEISSRTVELHFTLMKAKMGAKTLPHLIHLAHKQKIIS